MIQNGGKIALIRCCTCLLILLILAPSLNGQTDSLESDVPTFRTFDEKKLERIRENGEFQYGKEPIGKKKEHTGESDAEDENIASLFTSVWIILMYSLAFLMLGVLAVFVYKKTLGIRTGKAIIEDSIFDLDEDIRTLDLEEMALQAFANQDYRLSIRFLYLKCLKMLSQHGWIIWQPNKTNQDYLDELASTKFVYDFEQLTRQFDYIWYGHLDVGSRHYDWVARMFAQFQEKIDPKG